MQRNGRDNRPRARSAWLVEAGWHWKTNELIRYAVNNRNESGTNQRRITDSPGFMLCSPATCCFESGFLPTC
jgi:hypothetical protein